MEIIDFLKYVLIPSILAYIGYNEKDKISIKSALRNKITSTDAKDLIHTNDMVHTVQIRALDEDIKRMESKLDFIIENMLKRQ